MNNYDILIDKQKENYKLVQESKVSPIVGWFDRNDIDNEEEAYKYSKQLLNEKVFLKNHYKKYNKKVFYNIDVAGASSGKTTNKMIDTLFKFINDDKFESIWYADARAQGVKTLIPAFNDTFDLIAELTGLDLNDYLIITPITNLQNPMIKWKPEFNIRRVIRIEGMTELKIGQGMDKNVREIVVDEFLYPNENDDGTKLETAIRHWGKTMGKKHNSHSELWLMSNPFDWDNPTLDLYWKPFIPIEHTIEEREKLHIQHHVDKDAFMGNGINLISSSYHINNKISKTSIQWAEALKEVNYGEYKRMALGLNVGSESELYEIDINNIKEINPQEYKYDFYIAGLDVGDGRSSTCANFIGCLLKNNKTYLEIEYHYLDEFYWDNKVNGGIQQQDRVDKIVSFYKRMYEEYNFKTPLFIMSDCNYMDFINNEFNKQQLPIRAIYSNKSNYDYHKRNNLIRTLLTEDRLNATVNTRRLLKQEMSLVKVNNLKTGEKHKHGRRQFDRLDALEYAFMYNDLIMKTIHIPRV